MKLKKRTEQGSPPHTVYTKRASVQAYLVKGGKRQKGEKGAEKFLTLCGWHVRDEEVKQ